MCIGFVLNTVYPYYPKVKKESLKAQPVIEVIYELPETGTMPSYCKPESYRILKVPAGYVIMLSGGTTLSEIFKTPEKAQKRIIELADASKKRWLDTGGLDF